MILLITSNSDTEKEIPQLEFRLYMYFLVAAAMVLRVKLHLLLYTEMLLLGYYTLIYIDKCPHLVYYNHNIFSVVQPFPDVSQRNLWGLKKK